MIIVTSLFLCWMYSEKWRDFENDDQVTPSSKIDDENNAILEMELMMFKTEEQDMSSPKASTIIIIITGEPEGDDLEIVWENFEKEKENLRILNFTTSDH